MSKYNDYGEFMVAVLNEADNKCYRNSFGSLAKFFGLSGSNEKLIPIMVSIFKIGWPAFKATCALLILGPIAFIAALTTFVIGGVGAVIVATLAIYGGVKAIKLIYANKTIPQKIYDVGKKYKPRFDAHINEYSYIDNLIDEASNDIIN